MKPFSTEQLIKIRQRLAPHLADAPPAGAQDYPFRTLKTVLDPQALATREGVFDLSDALRRCCGVTITQAAA